VSESELKRSSKPTAFRRSKSRRWLLGPARAGIDIFSRCPVGHVFRHADERSGNLTGLGKSLPSMMANCTMKLSALMAPASW
jgi:hypothetical protein